MKIETKQVELTTQYADEGCWLYQDQGENFRYFTKKVLLGAGAEPWHECTSSEKEQYELMWEEQHPTELPEEIDGEIVESIQSV